MNFLICMTALVSTSAYIYTNYETFKKERKTHTHTFKPPNLFNSVAELSKAPNQSIKVLHVIVNPIIH